MPPPAAAPPCAVSSAVESAVQTRILENQIVEKDGALALLRQRLCNVERELLDTKSKLNKKMNMETKADQMAIDRMRREIQSLRAERDAQEQEMLEMDHARKALLKALDTERKKVMDLCSKHGSAAKNDLIQTKPSSKGTLEDEFNDLESSFAQHATSSKQVSMKSNSEDSSNSSAVDAVFEQRESPSRKIPSQKNLGSRDHNKSRVFFAARFLLRRLFIDHTTNVIRLLEIHRCRAAFSSVETLSSVLSQEQDLGLLFTILVPTLGHVSEEEARPIFSLLNLLLKCVGRVCSDLSQRRNHGFKELRHSRLSVPNYFRCSTSRFFLSSPLDVAFRGNISSDKTLSLSLIGYISKFLKSTDPEIVCNALEVLKAVIQPLRPEELFEIECMMDVQIFIVCPQHFREHEEIVILWLRCACELLKTDFFTQSLLSALHEWDCLQWIKTEMTSKHVNKFSYIVDFCVSLTRRDQDLCSKFFSIGLEGDETQNWALIFRHVLEWAFDCVHDNAPAGLDVVFKTFLLVEAISSVRCSGLFEGNETLLKAFVNCLVHASREWDVILDQQIRFRARAVLSRLNTWLPRNTDIAL
eukprot:TRINITY_DN39665_c0_g1_i1.p1 TRINITY_DN39665_c0_g1~~TRINITY_DN39665_c0_g1_i1.p1  ORF type:complete len:637 (+),score=104.30 TRINITY_DN39665_c0_g1_i1:159-1913(+)